MGKAFWEQFRKCGQGFVHQFMFCINNYHVFNSSGFKKENIMCLQHDCLPCFLLFEQLQKGEL